MEENKNGFRAKKREKTEKKFYKSERKEKSQSNNRDYKKKRHSEGKPKERMVQWPDDVIGIYAPGKWDFGFVDTEIKTENGIEKKWFYVFGRNSLNAMAGDKVLATVKEFNGKKEAVIKQVIAHRKEPVIGTYTSSGNFGFVLPKDKNIKKDIFVAGKLSMDAKDGDVVAVEIMRWEGRSPEGKVIQVLGKPGAKGVDIMWLALESGTRINFWRAVTDEVTKLTKKITSRDIAQRKDMRDLFTITIDGADSKDLDDAISLEKMEKWGYKLYVHIADVAHYVKEDHAIDKEARRRGTSTYLVNKVIPMLPETLSNGLCSLNPNEDKLTLSAEIEINTAGHIQATRVFESITKSDFRMTYKEVDQILRIWDIETLSMWDELMFGGKISKDLVEMLKNSEKLREILAGYKQELGVLGFDFPETKIELDENENPIAFTQYTRHHSMKIIEEFMIVANEAVSKKYQDLPFLYRVHPQPDEEDSAKLVESLAKFGYHLPAGKKLKPKDIQKVLDEVKWNPKEKLLSRMVLRSLTKAKYSPAAEWHFGLALDYYSHFTSPIRRYPDLQIHRIIKEKINRKLDDNRKKHYDIILDRVAKKSSEAEVKAEKLEYKVRDLMACKYMQQHLDESFPGTIWGVIWSGIFVELENTIEWFVELNDRFWKQDYIFDVDMMLLENQITGVKYTIWDKVNITVKTINEDERKINFELA